MFAMLPPEYLENCFSRDYQTAHRRFAHWVKNTVENSRYLEFVHPLAGPEGEPLAMAVAWQGAVESDRVLVVQSATHGVEGYAGSAIQLDAIGYFSKFGLPEGISILYIHAVNPFGFAWQRRVNEDGVDLNRNFVDFHQALPDNPIYDQLARAIVPDNLGDWAEADQQIYNAREELGHRAFETALTQGQYQHTEGLFYGGTAPSWSRLRIEQIMTQFSLPERAKVAVVDVHTGLGPYGYGEIICDHEPGSQGVHWAKSWYGESVTEPALGTSSSPPKLGLIDYGWQRALADKVCFVTLEFGTFAVERMFEVLRRDHFLHQGKVDWRSTTTQEVKAALRRHFYPGRADWQEMVLCRGRQVLIQAVNGLAER